jgi:hypothetical protein
VHFNVLGPNPQHSYDFETGEWDQLDETDVGFPIRRALVIRSVLGLDDDTPLRIEPALLGALLRVSRYSHSLRSLKKIMLIMRSQPGETVRRADLPSRGILARHLDDPGEIDAILAETQAYYEEKNLLDVAAAVHETFRRIVQNEPPDPHYQNGFDQLDAWGKATNVAAAARLPEILAMAGLRLAEGEASEGDVRAVREQIEHHIHVLAEREHELWREFHIRNDWTYAPVRDKPNRKHPDLVPFRQLSPDEQRKDYGAIRAYPELANLAGYKIVFIGRGPDPARAAAAGATPDAAP